MKKFIIPVLLLAACSSPKYTYNFSYHREGSVAAHPSASPDEKSAPASDLVITNQEAFSADAGTDLAPAKPTPAVKESAVAPEAASVTLTKAQKKELKALVKQDIKTYKKAQKAGMDPEKALKEQHQQAMDHDLKLAAIFGAVGIVALIISGDVFYILGGVALIIGVVFFVMWLSRQ